MQELKIKKVVLLTRPRTDILFLDLDAPPTFPAIEGQPSVAKIEIASGLGRSWAESIQLKIDDFIEL